MFDIYCLALTHPGVTHYGFYIMSFQFVYVGNRNVRNSLIVFALFSALLAAALFVTSCMLLRALHKVRLYWVLLEFTRFIPGVSWVLPGCTGLYWVLLGFTRIYWVLLDLAGFN